MRSGHHHPYHTLKEWHAGQREKRKNERWIPYSLRWKGGVFMKILPQVPIYHPNHPPHPIHKLTLIPDHPLNRRRRNNLHHIRLHGR